MSNKKKKESTRRAKQRKDTIRARKSGGAKHKTQPKSLKRLYGELLSRINSTLNQDQPIRQMVDTIMRAIELGKNDATPEVLPRLEEHYAELESLKRYHEHVVETLQDAKDLMTNNLNPDYMDLITEYNPYCTAAIEIAAAISTTYQEIHKWSKSGAMPDPVDPYIPTWGREEKLFIDSVLPSSNGIAFENSGVLTLSDGSDIVSLTDASASIELPAAIDISNTINTIASSPLVLTNADGTSDSTAATLEITPVTESTT